MNFLRVVFQIAGFLAFLAAFITLVSHSVAGLDFLHAGSSQIDEPMMAAGFLAHVVAAIMISGVAYLLLSIGNKGS